MTKKQLWMLVGGNGAGKSTFYKLALAPLGIPFINADIIAKELFPDNPEENSYIASQIASQMRQDQLIKGSSFCFETVFSHSSKIDFIAQAKAFDYEIILVFIHVNHVSINKARIHQRVLEGEHFVPDHKIESRIPRTIQNVKKAIPLCDEVRVLDNSSLEKPYQEVMTFKDGIRTDAIMPLPAWVQGFI